MGTLSLALQFHVLWVLILRHPNTSHSIVGPQHLMLVCVHHLLLLGSYLGRMVKSCPIRGNWLHQVSIEYSVRIWGRGLRVILSKCSLVILLRGMGLTFDSFLSINLVVLLVQVLLHVNNMSLVLGLHLKMSASMKILADADTLTIHSLHKGSHSWRCNCLWIWVRSMRLVVWSLEIIVTARSSFSWVLNHLGNILSCHIVKTSWQSTIELVHVVRIMIGVSVEGLWMRLS